MKNEARRVHTRSLADRLCVTTIGCADLHTLAQMVFDAVAADIPFAFACLATTDPSNGLIIAAYKSHPLPVDEQEFAAAEYGAPDINRFDELARRRVPVGVLSVDTSGHPEHCRRLRDYMTPQFGFIDEIRVVCRDHAATWGLLAIYRGQGQPAFTAADGRQLATVAAIIADAIGRTLFADRPTGVEALSRSVVLIVDRDNQLTDVSPTASDMIEELGGWDHGSLPASVLFVAASSRATGRPAEARVVGRSGAWVRVAGVALQGPTTDRSVVLTIQPADPAAVGRMNIAARGLTAREQQVVGLILQGASTKDIASVLHLSPHTVQDHLKAIFAKLHVSSRRELIGQFVLT